MINLFYASSNESKIQNLKNWLKGMPIHILTPKDIGSEIQVEESGNSVIENAALKVTAYYQAFGQTLLKNIPILAHDTGLYIDGLDEEEQPGIFVRRHGDHSMSDQESLDYYCHLVRERGELQDGYKQMTARYHRGAALCMNGKLLTKEFSAPDMYLTDTPSKEYREKGNPLDVSTIDPKTGKYWCDLSVRERDDAYGNFGTKIGEWILQSLSDTM